MLSPRWRKVLRDVWLHKSRTTLVILAISIGIVGAGAVLDTWALIRQATRDEFSESNPAAATLRTDSVNQGMLAEIRAMPEVQDAEARRTVLTSISNAGKRSTGILYVRDDFRAATIGTIKPEAGAWPPASGTLVVERSSVEFAETGIGERVVVAAGSGAAVELPVSGIARDVGLAPGWMEHVVYGFIDRATLVQLGLAPVLNEVLFTTRDATLTREEVRRIAFRIREKLEARGHAVADVDVPEPGAHIHAAQINSLLFTQGAFGALSLFMSAFLVVNLISAMLSGQVREIGIMKSIGASARQISMMYLSLALGLGLVACVIAVPLAAYIGRGYAAFTAEILNFSVACRSIPARVIWLQIAVGMLLPVLAAAIPVFRGCRISVGEALRDLGLVASGDRVSRLLHGMSGVRRPLLLSLRNAFRKRQRMLLTLATLSMGGAVFLGALNLKASIGRSVDLIFGAQAYHGSLRMSQLQDADSLEAAVRDVEGVKQAEAFSATRATIRHADGTLGNAFALVGPSLASRMFVPNLVSGRWLLASDSNAMVVNRRIVSEDGITGVGGVVEVVVGGRTVTWRIVGIVESGPTPIAFVDRTRLSALVSNGRVDRIAIVSADSMQAAVRDLFLRLRPALLDRGMVVQSSELTESNRRVIEDHLLMVAGFLGVMAQLMIVVGGLGLAATMSLGVMERTREIGVLKAIGAQHRAIFAMVQAEGLVIALASWLVALPLSVPMNNVLGAAFGKIMFRVPVSYVPEATAVLQWLTVVVVVSFFSCAWPAIRAMRITTAEALAYE